MKAAGTSPARVVAAVAAAQVTAGLGLYAVLAHLVVHLRHDLGLLASVVGVVLTLRSAVQYLLHLPVGVAIDRLGAHRAAGLACGVRAAGFALLAVATNPPALTLAATLIAVGGSVYIPAGKAILAGLPEDWARRGFAWYVITASLSAVAGPLFGLALLGSTVLTGRHGGLGFAGIAWSAAALWLVAGSLLGSLTIPTGARSRPVPRRLPAAVRDRGMIRLALVVSPAALLVTQAAVVVPLIVLNSRLTSPRGVADARPGTGRLGTARWRHQWAGPRSVAAGGVPPDPSTGTGRRDRYLLRCGEFRHRSRRPRRRAGGGLRVRRRAGRGGDCRPGVGCLRLGRRHGRCVRDRFDGTHGRAARRT
ncbi:MAG: hypothetical protein AUI14_06575 [Actinobacteria bacterium 13_2_20CM_2_71_6]|nr:MAG: hypothetical protein AUI14_06575 [Actinobacteria bacterium 13_2_20CM_2_71_6]